MQKDLLDDLVKKPQRETAGSDAASRFDYQKSWAFCEMLRRHMASADYLVAFEFHDDVVFIEPNRTPASADFFQVKTTSSAKPRKLADLVARKQAANSILGKMCLNFEGICSSYDTRIILVSNVPFEFADKDIDAKDIEPKYLDKIAEKLKAELPSWTESRIDRLHFVISGISIEKIQSYLHGEAMELFRSRFGETHGLNVHSWVRLVQSEITRKNNYASDKITNVDELVAQKCFSRAAVDETLRIVSGSKRAPDMAIISAELQAAGWSTTDLIRLEKKQALAQFDYTDTTNTEAQRIIEAIGAEFDATTQGDLSIAEFVANVIQKLLSGLSAPYSDKSYLSALAILVFYEKI